MQNLKDQNKNLHTKNVPDGLKPSKPIYEARTLNDSTEIIINTHETQNNKLKELSAFYATNPGNISALKIVLDWKYSVFRLTLAIFIEFYAYFFFRKYTKNLETVQNIQNELTNIQMKYAGLLTAIEFSGKKKDYIGDAIEQFTKTERNFVLQKGESGYDPTVGNHNFVDKIFAKPELVQKFITAWKRNRI
jgi:hypothetical protein